MLKIIAIAGSRTYSNPHPTPEGHRVVLVFQNDYGQHMLELNGNTPLPDQDPQLRSDLEYLLWDYGLLEQQDSKSDKQRVRIAEALWDCDRNHPLAKEYMRTLGAPRQVPEVCADNT